MSGLQRIFCSVPAPVAAQRGDGVPKMQFKEGQEAGLFFQLFDGRRVLDGRIVLRRVQRRGLKAFVLLNLEFGRQVKRIQSI